MAANARVGIELFLDKQGEFKQEFSGFMTVIGEMMGHVTGGSTFAKWQQEAGAAAKAVKATVAETATSSVDAMTRANELIAEQEKKYQALKSQYGKHGTQELLDDLKHLEDQTAKINGAIKKASDKETKAALQTKKDALQEETRLMRQLAKDTEEVQHLGAGARSGLLGVGRNLILGGGEYTGQIKKLGTEQKKIMLEMENAAKKEAEAELTLKKAQVDKEKGLIQEAEFEEIASMKRLEQAQAKSDQVELANHKKKIDTEIHEIKEKNEKSAESSEGGILKGAMGGLGGLAAVGGVSAAAGMLFEKGKENVEREEEMKIGLQALGMSAEDAEKKLHTIKSTSSEVSKELALNHAEVESATAAYLKMGGSSDNLKQKQEDIAALAKKSGKSMVDAAKDYALAGDPEVAKNLGRIGIVLDKNMSAAERSAAIHKKLQGTIEGMKDAADGPIGKFNKFKDVLETLLETVGGLIFTALNPLFSILGMVAGVISDYVMPVLSVLADIVMLPVKAFGVLAEFIKQNSEYFIALGVVVGVFALIMNASTIATTAATAAKAIAATVTGLLTVAQNGLNLSMLANPMVWMAALLAGLVIGIIYAYNHSKAFRDILEKVWETIKGVGKALADFGSSILSAIGLTKEETEATKASREALEKKNEALEEGAKKYEEYAARIRKADEEKTAGHKQGFDDAKTIIKNDLMKLGITAEQFKRATREEFKGAEQVLYDEIKKNMEAGKAQLAKVHEEEFGGQQADVLLDANPDDPAKKTKAVPVHKEAAGSSTLKQTQRLVKDNKEQEENEHQHSEVTIANYKARLAEIEKLGADSGTKALDAENKNYENKLKSARGNASLLKKLEADHLDAVEKLESKGANDLKDSKLLLAKEIRAAAKKIADDDFEDKKIALDKENLDERTYKNRTIDLQIEHNKRLMEIAADNIKERDKLEDANRKLQKQRRDDDYKEAIDADKVHLEEELGALADEHASKDTSNRDFEAKQYEAELEAAKASLELARSTYGEKSKEFDAFNKALEKLQHDHDVKTASKEVADRKEADKLRAELLTNLLDRELSIEDAHYAEEIKKFSDNEEMKSLITAQHNKKRADIVGQYYTEQNVIGKGFFGEFNKTADQGLSWLETRWQTSSTNQKTVLFGFVQAALGSVKDMVSGLIQSYEKKAVAFIAGEQTEAAAHSAATSEIVAGEAVKKGSFLTTVGTAIASAAATAAAWIAAGATMVANSAIWIASNLAAAASSMVTAVGSAIAWLTSTLGPFAIAAIPIAVAGLYGVYQGAKKVFGFEEGGLAKGARGFQFGDRGQHSGVFAENPKSAGEVFLPLEKVSEFVRASMPPIHLPTPQSHTDLSPLLAKFDELHGAVKKIQTHTVLDTFQTQLSINKAVTANDLTY